MKDPIEREEAIDALKNQMSDWSNLYNIPVRKSIVILEQLPSAQPQEDCDTCKHGYFGDSACNNCRVRFPSHYERINDG